jgi:hypothetical protein
VYILTRRHLHAKGPEKNAKCRQATIYCFLVGMTLDLAQPHHETELHYVAVYKQELRPPVALALR